MIIHKNLYNMFDKNINSFFYVIVMTLL